MEISTRSARPEDVPALMGFIRGLAEYENLEHEVEAEEDRLARDLFGPAPACWAFVAERDDQRIGFALCFSKYSTFLTAEFTHLEDLFVVPEARGSGAGAALLRTVVRDAAARGHRRVEWSVLDWNESAIGFYRGMGAQVLPDWRTCRLSGEALAALAASN